MNYIFFAFLAAVCFGTSNIINKILSKHSINNTDSLMAYFMLSTSIFGFFLIPFVDLSSFGPAVFQLVLPATLFFLVGYYFFYKGVFSADASTFAPLFQLQAGLIAILAYIFLGERFPLVNYFWIALMTLGTIFVSYNEKLSFKSFLSKGVLFIIGMQVMHAISNIFIGKTLVVFSPVEILFWENMLIGILFLLFYFFRKPKLNYPLAHTYPMFISSFVVGIGVISLFTAFQVNLTISSVIGMLSAPLVFVVSLIASTFSPAFLEHHPAKVYWVRGIGLAILLLSAYMISVG